MSEQDQRPRFYEGQYLGAADLEAAIDYGRLQHARHLLGAHLWGIVVGLQLRERAAAGGGGRVDVFIDPGYAVDGFGRPIVLAAPQPVPESLFADYRYDATRDIDGKGRLIQVWLRYDEQLLRPPAPGFGSCDDEDARSRVQESFRLVVGDRSLDEQHPAISVAGSLLRVEPTAPRVNPASSPIYYDESVPQQTFPDAPFDGWLIPIGYVRWLPVNGGAGHFVKRDDSTTPGREKDSDLIRRSRRYVGAVVEEILAADQAVRVRDRSRHPSANFLYPAAADPNETDPDKLPTNDLLFVEGATRVEGDMRLVGGALDMLTAGGTDADVPLRIRRRERVAGVNAPALEAQIGTVARTDIRFAVGPAAVGPAPDGGTLDEKLTVMSGGNVGIATPAPATQLHVTGDRVRLEKAGKRLDLRTDGSAVDVQSETDSLYLRATGPAPKNNVIINHDAADGNVGIGTEAPTHKLHVAATSGIRQNALYVTGATGWSSITYNAYHNAGNNAWVLPDASHKAITIELDDNGGPRFEVFSNLTADPAAWRSHLKVNGTTDSTVMAYNGGKVGIGTTTPEAQLTVAAQAGGQGKFNVFTATADVDYDGGADGLFIFNDRGGRTAFRGGRIGVNTLNPVARLHVAESQNADASNLESYVAVIENTNVGDNADVLALKIGRGSPTPANNYVTFFAGGSIAGRIEGTNAGGIAFLSGSGDFAECIDLVDAGERLEEGDVIGIFDGCASRRTRGAQHVSAVTARPIVVGNARADAPPHAMVAFMGQVPVKVRGLVRAGDCIVPSGLDDGTGQAVPPAALTPEQLAQVVGQAWESSDREEVKPVRTAIGLVSLAPAASLAAEIAELRRQLAELRSGR